MAAAALELSVLESKDKATLLEMAKALGVKASASLKKADIIEKIIDSTGGGSGGSGNGTSAAAASSASSTANGADARVRSASADDDRDVATAGASSSDSTSDHGSSDDAAASGSKRIPAPPQRSADSAESDVPPADEPMADWERELGSPNAGATQDSAAPSTSDDDNGAATGERGTDRGARTTTNGEATTASDGRSAGDAKSGGSSGEARRDQRDNRNNQQRPQDGDGSGSSRRRRRRRKNKGGQDGPQGDDAELLEQDAPQPANEPVEVSGYLDIRDEGYGFLRVNGYLPSKQDAYISVKLARQYGLRKGDEVTGTMRPGTRNEKNPQVLEIKVVNGSDPEQARTRPRFEDLTALFPDKKLVLEDPSDPTNMTARIIDLVSPIGKGQRGIIVSPPKAGKTTVMKTIAQSIERNNPEVELIVLLIDERPEEVTDMRRSVKGEVISSTFDRPSDEHTAVAEMAIAKAKRHVEEGKDVVVILDGITRLSRAYNLAAPASGRILSGGIDAGALYPPKKFFGAARNVEEGGSLTILATALVDTNSRMDEAIFEEFKGTGNMELRLDRKVAERRIYPAIDVDASSTRHEELLFDRKQLQMVWKLRRVLSGLAADGNAAPGLELLIDRLKTFRTNAEFLAEIGKQPGM